MFEQLYASDKDGEFYGSMCRWHKRRDGQITIYEIIVEENDRGLGIGRRMIERLIAQKPTSIVAVCPADLPSNGFYEHMGFSLEDTWENLRGRKLKRWVLQSSSTVRQATLDLPK